MRQSCPVTALQEGVIRANGVKLKSLSVIDLSAHYEAVEELLVHERSGLRTWITMLAAQTVRD